MFDCIQRMKQTVASSLRGTLLVNVCVLKIGVFFKNSKDKVNL